MRRKYIFVVLFLTIFHLIFSYIWLKNDHYSFFREKFYKLYEEHDTYIFIKDKACEKYNFINNIKRFFNYVTKKMFWSIRLSNIYAACMNGILGRNDMNSAILWNIPFMSLGLLFVYLTGSRIASPLAGFLSSFVLSFYPGFYGMSRSFGIDFPIIAMMAVILYYFAKAEDSFNISYVLQVGAVIFITLLINTLSILFLCGLFLYAITHGVSIFRQKGIRKILNVLVIILLVAGAGFPWWPAVKIILQDLSWRLLIAKFEHTSWPNILEWAGYFLTDMVKETSFFLFVFLLWGVIFLKNSKYILLFLAYSVIPFCTLLFFTTSFNRYFFPLFVVFALVTGIGLAGIKNHKWKKPVMYAVVFISIMQFFDLSFGTNFLPEKVFYALRSRWAASPDVNDEAVAAERLLGAISDYINSELDKIRVILAGNPMLIDSGVMQYIFLSRTNKYMLQRFFYSKKDDPEADFIIIVNENRRFLGIPPVPDLSFLSKETFNGYFAARYPNIAISEDQLKYMRSFFQTFRTIDYFTSGDRVYYLCVNPALDFS